jgi:hypothetical protein
MTFKLRRSPAYVLSFVLFISVFQVIPFGVQFVHGFRPFGREPIRVPFSWDMFATRVERCSIKWDPPIRGPGSGFSSLRQLGTLLEWDDIEDHIEDYRHIARWVCFVGSKTTRIRLHCFLPTGIETDDEIKCK